jgi:beta-lactamase superfamily II metal-dependent hydrolase
MWIRIFDVTHGFCAYIVADDGDALLIDCGYNTENGFHPSDYLRRQGRVSVQGLVVSNYDEDHLRDLPGMLGTVRIEALYRNKSVGVQDLRRIKLGRSPLLGPGTEALFGMMGAYTRNVGGPYLSGAEIATFCNPYPAFDDTNNLSLVTFIHYRDIHIVFPGDLERPGWRALLGDPWFRGHLSRVNFFVASHHGRENGYLADVFEYCRPAIAILSDGPIRYETQNTGYGRHASGIPWKHGGNRRVLTTRKDGMISIWQRPQDLTSYVDTAR